MAQTIVIHLALISLFVVFVLLLESPTQTNLLVVAAGIIAVTLPLQLLLYKLMNNDDELANHIEATDKRFGITAKKLREKPPPLPKSWSRTGLMSAEGQGGFSGTRSRISRPSENSRSRSRSRHSRALRKAEEGTDEQRCKQWTELRE